MSPFAEMIAAHFQVVSGGCRFANLIHRLPLPLFLPWAPVIGFLLAGALG